MQSRVKWLDHMTFVAESGSGHTVVMDGSPEHGGRNLGVRPMEMVLMGLGGCTAFDVMLMLQKSRQLVTDCEIELKADRADEIPAVFTAISVHFKVYGHELSEKQVKRAVSLSSEKYCSVSKMLESNTIITVTHEILPAANGEPVQK